MRTMATDQGHICKLLKLIRFNRADDLWHAICQPHSFMNVPSPNSNGLFSTAPGRFDDSYKNEFPYFICCYHLISSQG